MAIQGVNDGANFGRAMIAPPGGSEVDLKQADDLATIGKLSKDFESIFLEIVLKSMRDAVPKTELLGKSNGEDIFKSMLDGEYSKQIAEQKMSGIAKNIEEQLLKAYETQQQADASRGQAVYDKAAKSGIISTMVAPPGLK